MPNENNKINEINVKIAALRERLEALGSDVESEELNNTIAHIEQTGELCRFWFDAAHPEES